MPKNLEKPGARMRQVAARAIRGNEVAGKTNGRGGQCIIPARIGCSQCGKKQKSGVICSCGWFVRLTLFLGRKECGVRRLRVVAKDAIGMQWC